AGLAALGFALEGCFMGLMWAGPKDIADIDPLKPVVFAIISTPVVGIVAVGAIAISVAVLWWRARTLEATRWAVCVAVGIALHCILLVAASMAARARWHMNGLGRPDGALAVVLPSGHMVAQLAILVGAIAVVCSLVTARSGSRNRATRVVG